MTQSPYEKLPRSVLFLGPFIVLGAAIALLAITSPIGDLTAMETATLGEMLTMMLLIGLIVGIVPVAIGMLWFPFMRTLDHSKLHIVLALSAGVLAFVGVEMTEEAIEYAAAAPSPSLAAGLAIAAFIGTFLLMVGVSRWSLARAQQSGNRGLGVAYLVALGLGLHSLGEGIAIGSSLLLGEAALAMLLIIGFILDNVTEGPTIVAAVARDAEAPPLLHFATLGVIAGGPVVLGGWIAAFAFSPVMAAALLAVGIGAIVQVILQVIDLIQFDAPRVLTRANMSGFVGGFVFMFLLDEIMIDMILL
ncbi:ZIP family metal transporter [Natrialba sp. SSL1]|uniref:ZIP family metal transporter n=1 Tax=Natrialba sp. SSL1 TaxID=1869245 RepID=UPI0008F87A4A|nr:metal cation transporter [Natrialba sp. SSL1]OIB57360.1 metal cation transporter [Natrialba sp. SSL1]